MSMDFSVGLYPTSDLEANTGSTSRLPEEGDVVGVSSERADVPVDPGDGRMLVPQAVVTCSKQLILIIKSSKL